MVNSALLTMAIKTSTSTSTKLPQFNLSNNKQQKQPTMVNMIMPMPMMMVLGSKSEKSRLVVTFIRPVVLPSQHTVDTLSSLMFMVPCIII
jgi:hypothetical protein